MKEGRSIQSVNCVKFISECPECEEKNFSYEESEKLERIREHTQQTSIYFKEICTNCEYIYNVEFS